MQDVEIEKKSYGIFERVLYLFVIPIMFTAILTVVLLSIFDYDVMNSVLRVANKVPVLEKVIPDPVETAGEGESQPNEYIEPEGTSEIHSDLIDALHDQLLERETEIEQLNEIIAQKNAEVEALAEQIASLEAEREQQTISEEQYRENIRDVAKIYADMMPSRSAAVIQNLTLSEQVLVLSEMKTNEQVRILEKMTPQAAAEASILLKDDQLASDLQIQALQERLQRFVQAESEAQSESAE